MSNIKCILVGHDQKKVLTIYWTIFFSTPFTLGGGFMLLIPSPNGSVYDTTIEAPSEKGYLYEHTCTLAKAK